MGDITIHKKSYCNFVALRKHIMIKKRRNTRTKNLVFSVLEKDDSVLCHEQIEKRLPEKIDRVTIYRILQGFCDEGKVHKIIDQDGKTCYALCHNCTAKNHRDDHPHFHCIIYDRITCIEKPVIRQTLPPGFRAVTTDLFISGYCQKCNAL